jgi:hypothetical protein
MTAGCVTPAHAGAQGMKTVLDIGFRRYDDAKGKPSMTGKGDNGFRRYDGLF